MSKLTEYLVVREHEGDRFYAVGDTRTAAAVDVKHLIPHVLEEVGPAVEPEDKPDDAAPAPDAVKAPKPNKGKQPAIQGDKK